MARYGQEKTNDGKHIATVINRTPCTRHNKTVGQACWNIILDSTEEIAHAICDKRIKEHGFTGKISQTAMQLKRTTSPAPYKKKEVRA